MRASSWLLGFFGGLLLLGFLGYAAYVDKIQVPGAMVGGVGALMIVAWFLLNRASLARWSGQRGARYTTTAVILTALGLGVVVATNVIGSRYDKRWDLTSTRRFSLADQTVSVLKGLDKPVKILAFFSMEGAGDKDKFKDLVEGYTQKSTLVTVEFHDPMKEPMLAEQYKITSAYGTVVLESGDSKQRIESDFKEESLTNAIIRLTSGKEHLVCFTQGHGELDPDDDQSAGGMGASIVKLEGQNYKIKKINPLTDGGISADCEVAIVADPQVEWLPAEREILAAYVAGGGKALLLIDPTHDDAFAADLSRYGIAVGNDLVLEQNPNRQVMGGDASFIVLTKESFEPHAITDPIKGLAVLRLARSVDKGPDIAGIKVQTLAKTSEYAWAETTLDGSTPPQPDPGKDRVGAIPVAAVAEISDPTAVHIGARTLGAGGDAARALLGTIQDATPPTPTASASSDEVARKAGGKVVVFGDSDFAANELVDQGNNQDLLLNSIAWLVGEEDQVSIRTPEGANGSLTMDELQGILMVFLTLILAPGVAIAMAVATWRRRRNS